MIQYLDILENLQHPLLDHNIAAIFQQFFMTKYENRMFGWSYLSQENV